MRNKRKKGKMMSLVMAFGMSLSVLGGVATNSLQVKAGVNVSNPRIEEDGTVTWDKVKFGSYYQDIKEITVLPIKWRIIDIDENGNALLLADEALDCKPYNDKGVVKIDSEGVTYTDYSCTWETCTLRAWLNGTGDYANDSNAFINAAFTEEEKKAIVNTTLVNMDTSPYTNENENNLIDKVYLLSIEDVQNSTFGFDTALNESSRTRNTVATDYARLNGVYIEEMPGYVGNCSWWLRSLDNITDKAPTTIGNGMVFTGTADNSNSIAIRPALHVNLLSSYVMDAGKVMSDGKNVLPSNRNTPNQYGKPLISDGVTTWDCVYFGNYKQKVSFEKMPIEWRVLSVNGDDAFVVAEKALDCKQYNLGLPCTWETCMLRAWLNGTDKYESDDTAFIKAAFSEEERNAIIKKTIVNDDNPQFNTSGGNDTEDKLYVLSIGELSNSDYGFDVPFDRSSWKKVARATDYAKFNGAFLSDDPDYEGACRWWVRAPGATSYDTADMYFAGWGSEMGCSALDKDHCVRPSMHIDLSSSCIKVAGTVSIETDYNIEAHKKADKVIKLISAIGTVTRDSKAAIDSARNAYDALSETGKNKVTNYGVLQEAESKYAELTKSGSNGNDNVGENDDNGSLSNSGNASETTGGNTDNTSNGNTGTTPATTETASNSSVTTEIPKDNLTTFNIKNKKTYKKSQKVKIADEDGIKSVVLNTKKIKVKKGKKSVSFKLSSYKKNLKKKNKWNKIIVTDVNGNKKTVQFKVK